MLFSIFIKIDINTSTYIVKKYFKVLLLIYSINKFMSNIRLKTANKIKKE